MESILSRRWLVLVFAIVLVASLGSNVSLAVADHDDFEESEEEHDWGYGPEWWGPDSEGEDGPEEGEGPQCSPEWLREWYLWEDPEDDEDWWYYWEYKWCQVSGEEDWVKSYGDWYWWGPAGEDETDELLEELS